MQAEIADSISARYSTPRRAISDTYKSGVMDGYAQGMNWHMDQSLPAVHVPGRVPRPGSW